MLIFRALKILPILIVGVSTIYCSLLPSNASQKLPSLVKNTMSSGTGVLVKNIFLQSREEKILPLGVPQNLNRDIGFASVFLHIENSSEQNTKLIIQKIEVRNASDGKVQKFSHQRQEIHLHPLENSENAFHLTNKTGYVGQDRVKAVITYKVGSQVYVIESDPVNVKRH